MVLRGYDRAFYEDQMEGSARSASVIVPVVLDLVPAKSVIDLGCGIGAWLSEFMKYGITDIQGLDGGHVPLECLRIPTSHFIAADLSRPIKVGRSFDLAVSVEVAEHLPPACAASFARDLTCLAPVVLFSAAVPKQGGKDHLNEQWPDYWESLFNAFGYVAIDVLRSQIWDNEEVEWWYRQNLFLYVRESKLNEYPTLITAARNPPMPRRVVHPLMLEQATHRPNLAVQVFKALLPGRRRLFSAKEHTVVRQPLASTD